MGINNFLSLTKNSNISKLSKIYPFSIITNSNILNYTYVSYSCRINNCTIGKYCSIARNVKIGLGTHPIDHISSSSIFYSYNNPFRLRFSNTNFQEFKPVTIGHDVWIGVGSTILDGISIGNGAIIGANSVVTKDIPPYAIVGGVPAKIIKYRFSFQIIDKLIKSEWWNLPICFFEISKVKVLFSDKLDLGKVDALLNIIKEFRQKDENFYNNCKF